MTPRSPTVSSPRRSAEELRLIERFTRVGPDTLEHEFTVDDPGTYAASWTAMIPLTRSDDPIFEYACHEGNIGWRACWQVIALRSARPLAHRRRGRRVTS